MESDARSEIVAAVDQDITIPAAQKRINDARLAIELVSARRSKLRPPHSALQERLREQFQAEVVSWNNKIVAARKAKECEIVKANLPFYDGDERGFRKHFNFDAVPCMIGYRKAFANMPPHNSPASDLVRDVGVLINDVKRWSAKLGIS